MAGKGLLSLMNLPDSSAAKCCASAAEPPFPKVMNLPPLFSLSSRILDISMISLTAIDFLESIPSAIYLSSYLRSISNKDHPAPGMTELKVCFHQPELPGNRFVLIPLRNQKKETSTACIHYLSAFRPKPDRTGIETVDPIITLSSPTGSS